MSDDVKELIERLRIAGVHTEIARGSYLEAGAVDGIQSSLNDAISTIKALSNPWVPISQVPEEWKFADLWIEVEAKTGYSGRYTDAYRDQYQNDKLGVWMRNSKPATDNMWDAKITHARLAPPPPEPSP